MNNRTQTSPKAITRAFTTTAVLSIAALALAGCGEGSDDPRVDEDPQEEIDPSGGEEYGVYSDDIAESEDDQQAADLAEIEEDVWDSSMDQESVNLNVVGGLDRGQELLGYNPEVFEGEGEQFDMEVAGELEGDSSTELNYVSDFQVLTFGDDTYQSVAGFVLDYEAQIPAEVDPEVDSEELDAALSAEGEWVDVSDSELAVPRTPAELLSTLREQLNETLGVDSLAELEFESSVDTRDGENVWVYSNEELEFAVLADEGSPQLMGIVLPGEDEALEVSATEWNEAGGPEEPEDETVIEDEELQGILNSLV